MNKPSFRINHIIVVIVLFGLYALYDYTFLRKVEQSAVARALANLPKGEHRNLTPAEQLKVDRLFEEIAAIDKEAEAQKEAKAKELAAILAKTYDSNRPP